jgi:hypothetical protein
MSIRDATIPIQLCEIHPNISVSNVQLVTNTWHPATMEEMMATQRPKYVDIKAFNTILSMEMEHSLRQCRPSKI